ncbi:MAG: DUF1788 domain-containing protein [Pirellulales bacterium]|nr:DUF1788 domain-containing protein [Pirellulales bacterium]
MSDRLTDRLNEILPKIISEDFLSGKGLGNEIAFYIFDYLPEEELRVRDHVRFLLEHIPKQKPDLRVAHVNLFDLIIDHLKERNLLDRSFQMQRQKGDDALEKALRSPLKAEKLAQIFVDFIQPAEHDLVLVSGVGSVWPLIRTHSLLSNLHPVMKSTPLVMFYPGRYDGQSLRLFGRIKTDHYYRAFKLVP